MYSPKRAVAANSRHTAATATACREEVRLLLPLNGWLAPCLAVIDIIQRDLPYYSRGGVVRQEQPKVPENFAGRPGRPAAGPRCRRRHGADRPGRRMAAEYATAPYAPSAESAPPAARSDGAGRPARRKRLLCGIAHDGHTGLDRVYIAADRRLPGCPRSPCSRSGALPAGLIPFARFHRLLLLVNGVISPASPLGRPAGRGVCRRRSHGSPRYFRRVAIPPRIWRSALFSSNTSFTRR